MEPELGADEMDALTQGGESGLKGQYFNNMDFTSPVLERVDASIDFDWGKGSPNSKVDADTFSVRWTGFVTAKYSQTYTFYIVGDDGIRLYVDNKLVVNDWSNHGARERSGTLALKAGQSYPIKLEYYESSGGAVAKLLWSSSSQAKQIIPAAQLRTELSDSGGDSGGETKNLALGKPTSQSSTAYNGLSSRAVDGNTSGRYSDSSVTHTNSEAAPWWRVDLGGANSVGSVVLFNRTDCCGERLSNFNVDYLDQSGKVIATKLYAGAAPAQTTIALAAQNVYSVRVRLNGTNALSLAEVQVFGSTGGSSGGGGLCAEAIENGTASLSCPSGQKIMAIQFASYGLPTGTCDSGFSIGTCHATTSKAVVESACLNAASCDVQARNSVFGDPCSGKAKSLKIAYSCGGGSVPDAKITHIGTSSIWDGDGQNIKIARPSGSKAGDLLVLILHRTDDDLPLYVNGWTRVAECYKRDNGYACSTEADCKSWHNDDFCSDFGGHGGHDLAQSIFYRKVSSTEPTSYSFNLNTDSSGHPGWIILSALRGAATTNPVRDWAHMGCDRNVRSVFPSVYGVAGDMVLLSQSFDDKVAQSKFAAPNGTTTFGYVSNSDEAGFLFGGTLNKTGETGSMTTLGEGASDCKDALVSLTIKPQ
jgi:fibro-slime domain-containing protein